MIRHLRRMGHEVTVLTTSAFGTLEDDAPWVVRTGDLQGPGLLRKLLRRPPAPLTAGGAADPGVAAPTLLTDGLVPDAHLVTWLPYAWPKARRLVRERGIDVVVTNGPPDSTHLLGPRLKRPWIADLEDGWRFEPQRFGWPTRAQDRLDAALERRTLSRAARITSIARPISEDAERRFGVPAATVYNGFDPGDVEPAEPPPLEPGTVSVVHTGALSHAQRRDPRAFFEGLGRLDPGTPVRLVLAGGLTAEDRALLDGLEPRVRALVHHLGPLPRARSIALQRAADALLLVATGPQRSSITGKIFEYLAAGRPILALSADNEAARIVRETGAGVVVDPSDPRAAAEALAAVAAGGLPYSPRDLERYRFPAVAEEMERAIRAALHSPRS
jgi:glycosyltransferase involved in cell wall biosynthesis